MKVRYLGPADRLVVGGTRIRRGEVGEISKAEYDALGAKQSRVAVLATRKAATSSTRSSKPTRRQKPTA